MIGHPEIVAGPLVGGGRGAVEREVVDDHQFVVLRVVVVELDQVRAGRERQLERGQGVFRRGGAESTVTDDERTLFLKQALGRGLGKGRCEQGETEQEERRLEHARRLQKSAGRVERVIRSEPGPGASGH